MIVEISEHGSVCQKEESTKQGLKLVFADDWHFNFVSKRGIHHNKD
jgi:hypothetical protein